jgi:hypothetical protein
MVEVTGATVTVDKYAMALLRVSTRTGRTEEDVSVVAQFDLGVSCCPREIPHSA